MNTKYLAGLLGANALFAALSVAALILFATHSQFRKTVGHDQPNWDKFVARVESGKLHYNTNLWLIGMKEDHQVIQTEERVSDRMAGRLMIIGAFGLLTVLFQTWVIFSLRNNLRKP